jgi:Predicted transcriptional regulator
MPQMLGDFLKPIQTISFAELAEALGCNESTLYRWLKDETIKLPKPIQIGKKKMCFIYSEIESWLYTRPRFNSFYNVSTKKFELTNVESTEDLVSKHLMNEKTTIEFIEEVDLTEDHKILIPCISIKNIKLFNWLIVEKYLALRCKQRITTPNISKKERKYIITKNL